MLRKAILLGVFLAMAVFVCAAAPSNNTTRANIDQAATAIGTASSTAPSGISINAKGVPNANAISACSGNGVLATQYLAELVPIPQPRRLDLFTTGGTCPGWKILSNPSDSTIALVQDAFSHVPSTLTVRIWYTGNTITGLVVSNP